MILKRSSRWTWFSVVWFVVAIGTVVFDGLSIWTMGAAIIFTIAEATSDILRSVERRSHAASD